MRYNPTKFSVTTTIRGSYPLPSPSSRLLLSRSIRPRPLSLARAPTQSFPPFLSLLRSLSLSLFPLTGASLRLTRKAAERSIPFLAPVLRRFRPGSPSLCPPPLALSLSLLYLPFPSPFPPPSRLTRRSDLPPSLPPSLHPRPSGARRSLLSLHFAPSCYSPPQRVTLSLIQHAVPAQRNDPSARSSSPSLPPNERFPRPFSPTARPIPHGRTLFTFACANLR